MVGAFFVLLRCYGDHVLFISQWLRVTVFVSAMVVWLAVSAAAAGLYPMALMAVSPPRPPPRPHRPIPGPTPPLAPSRRPAPPTAICIPPQTEPPTSANLTNWLNAFSSVYAAEQKRKTPFTGPAAGGCAAV
ncbi:hypothetical protein [Klebsiella pneumoniae]|uniref:hypothetical protein n=1 Tax=Klebsiella pneumoniae TaxID=573 RepID=UPI0039888AF3